MYIEQQQARRVSGLYYIDTAPFRALANDVFVFVCVCVIGVSFPQPTSLCALAEGALQYSLMTVPAAPQWCHPGAPPDWPV